MPAVEEHLNDNDEEEMNKELLNTIKIPRNMKLLVGKLPKSQYEEDKMEERDEVIDLLNENNQYNPSPPNNDYINSIAPSTATNKEERPILNQVQSKNNLEEHNEIIREIQKKKQRKNPKTTPMNLAPLNKPKKYEMYRDLNKIKDNYDIVRKRGYKNLQRAKELNIQEQKLK